MKHLSRFLITGGNCPLAKALIARIIKTFPDLTFLVLTSRCSNSLHFTEPYIRSLFLDLNQDFYSSTFLSEIDLLAPFDSIIHCASPYPTDSLMKVTQKSLSDFSKLIANEMCLLRELVLKLKPTGSLIVCGSVSGMRADTKITSEAREKLEETSHIGNFKHCTMHAMHKGVIRDFTNCLYQSNPDSFIVHANLGPFMATVPEEKKDEILSVDKVADSILQIITSPKLNTFSIDIGSGITTDKLHLLRTLQESMPIS